MAPVHLRYAVKANPHPALLATLRDGGAHFAVVSLAELEALLALDVAAERIACVTPGPPASLVRRCQAAGVRRLAADSAWELRKIAALVPGATVLLTLHLPAAGLLRYPAARVGATLAELGTLLAAARDLPLDLAGVAFHVGSQCERLAPWGAGVALAARAWRCLQEAGQAPRILSLGGGLPVAYRRPPPEPARIARTIQAAIAAHFSTPPAELWFEPGRYVAASAGVLAATVVARDPRAGRPRLMLDVGRYQGLPEAALGIRYPYWPSGLERCVLVGPLGARHDLLDRAATLPPLLPGNRLYLLQAGAYTAVQSAGATHPVTPRVEMLPAGVELDTIVGGA